MKRLIPTFVLSFLAIIAAIAQDKFPDVPENHWASKEIAPTPVTYVVQGVRDGFHSPWIWQGLLVVGVLCAVMVTLTQCRLRRL